MKKLIAPIVVLCIVGAVITFAIMPSTPAASKKLQESIQNELSMGKTVFLQLSSTGCVTCRKMQPEVEKAAAEFNGKSNISVIKIDVDSNPKIASQYAVTGVPTQVILNKSGKELFRNMGYMSFDNIKYALSSTK